MRITFPFQYVPEGAGSTADRLDRGKGHNVTDISRKAESRLRVSRRGFLKASGVGAAAAATGGIGAIPFAASKAAAQQGWDEEHDIVVVGSGAAAFAAAITAKSLGNDAVMFEKGAYVGGTTLVSGGGGWFPSNPRMQEDGFEDPKEDAQKYMARYSWPHLYNPTSPTLGLPQEDYDLLSAFYDTAGEAATYLEEQGAITWTYGRNFGPNFDQVQIDYMESYEENLQPKHRTLHPTLADGNPGGGGDMIGGYQAWAEANDLPIRLYHRVENVITNTRGEIVGVEVSVQDPAAAATAEATPGAAVPAPQTMVVRARKGVIFGSGGFARNADMMHHLMPAPYYGGCSAPTNEGDLLRIATTLGAKLGNLHNVYRNEGIFEQAIASTGAYNCTWFLNGDSFMQVNKTGKRYVNEKRAYQDRPMAHQDWDPNYGDWTSRLSFLIYDGRMQENWGGRFPLPEDPDTAPYIIKGDTIEELADAISERVESLREVTGGVRLDPDFKANLAAELEKFNGFARTGEDKDFKRGSLEYDVTIPYGPYSPTEETAEYPTADQPNPAMYPLREEGPYYAFIMSQAAVDTNGGPVINPNAQITRWDGSAIEGLYGAGNCIASPGVNAYWGGGMTIGNATVWGYRAARHATDAPEKSVD
jgi:succinate dehydrogenase/fumarate reductase flavoprotein subunit